MKPFEDATARRTLYLEAAKRRKLVEKASAEAKALFAPSNALPMSPGEVAALGVEYLKASQRSLEIPTGKTEARIIPLAAEPRAFKTCAKGKLPAAWLVPGRWIPVEKGGWRDEIKDAAKRRSCRRRRLHTRFGIA